MTWASDMVARMSDWALLTNHGRALVCLAQDPDLRLRELADCIDVTERAAQRIVTELWEGGLITKERHGRRNRYAVVEDRVIDEPGLPARTVGDLTALAFASANGRVERRAGRDRRDGRRRETDRAATG